jgi:hypothetical protein
MPEASSALMARPVEGADAEAVAAEDDALARPVPQGDGELAAQVLEHPLLVVLPAVGDDFGVAVGGEAVAAALQFGLHLGVVEQLAVVDDGDGAVLVADRLPAVSQPDDAEAPRGEADARLFEIAVLVGPAVDDGVGHGAQRPRRRRPPLPRQVNHPRDATHPMIQ